MPPTHHAKLSASGAASWTVCTAGPDFIEKNRYRLPKNDDTVYSREGTVQHEWNEKLILGEVALDDIPDANREWAAAWQKVVTDLCVGPGQLFVEEKVPLFYYPGTGDYGTLDLAWVLENEVHIRDYKHGMGVIVEIEYNKQLSIYALSLIRHLTAQGLYDFSEDTIVTIGIFQPRTHGGEEPKVWQTSLRALEQFGLEIEDAVATINYGTKTEFKPSYDVCRWCKAKDICDVRKSTSFEHFPDQMSPMTLNVIPDSFILDAPEPKPFDPADLGHEQRLFIMANKKQLISIIEGVEDYMAKMAYEGNPQPGTKFVAGREGNRKWVNEKAVISALRNQSIPTAEFTEQKLLSVSKIHKIPLVAEKIKNQPKFAKRITEELVERSPARPKLVLESDPRPALLPDTLPPEFTNTDDES